MPPTYMPDTQSHRAVREALLAARWALRELRARLEERQSVVDDLDANWEPAFDDYWEQATNVENALGAMSRVLEPTGGSQAPARGSEATQA